MRVDTDVLNALSNAATEGNTLRLTGQLDRKLYERTNKVLEAAGGKWNRKAKAHTFPGDAAEAMEQIILSGEVTVPQNFGYFPTPPEVVERLMARAQVEPGMGALEPSAGTGNIVRALNKAGALVEAVELLKANYDALLKQGCAETVICGDFLALPPDSFRFDRVVMNPPFAKQDDIRHVMHAAKFLKPGGRLVSVMSASVTFRDNKLTDEFRAMLDERDGSIEELADGAFKASGTAVRTVIVSMEAA